MLFQIGVGDFRGMMYYMQQWGVMDLFLPFILIFTILFAVLQKIGLFGAEGKKYNVALSVAMALLVVIPHVMGTYPPGKDVVEIINNSIPEVALLMIVVVMVLLMLGLTRGEKITGGYIGVGISIIAAAILAFIFIGNLSPVPILNRIDPALQSLIVILLIFGGIVYYVGREAPSTPSQTPLHHRWWGPPPTGGQTP